MKVAKQKNPVSVNLLSTAGAGALNARRLQVFVKDQPVGEVTARVDFNTYDGEERTLIRISTRDRERLRINRIEVRMDRGVESAPSPRPVRWRCSFDHSDRGLALASDLPTGVLKLLGDIADAVVAVYEDSAGWKDSARIFDSAWKVRNARRDQTEAEQKAESAFHRTATAVEALRALGIENTSAADVERLIASNPD